MRWGMIPNKKIRWSGEIEPQAVKILNKEGGLVVCATKVGYILMASDLEGLERKFEAKMRKRNKPAVVLCSSMEQFKTLAAYNEKILRLYEMHWEQDILLGCILPWSEKGKKYLKKAGTSNLVMDNRHTSCFVIKFGTPSEQIARELWSKQQKIIFASSANPSGLGNKGKVDGIGERIKKAADLIIAADDYIASIQPNKSEATRYEQGVMVSMVNQTGQLVTGKEESSLPTLIRKGLSVDTIMLNLAEVYQQWNYRHGNYY